mmetsp:Transcript_71279/g.231655  ORF Transcript_71279/g.231655 Transcript_71279/m.231655 type:complete len:276 (-) Transcript_71279:28-855(-)
MSKSWGGAIGIVLPMPPIMGLVMVPAVMPMPHCPPIIPEFIIICCCICICICCCIWCIVSCCCCSGCCIIASCCCIMASCSTACCRAMARCTTTCVTCICMIINCSFSCCCSNSNCCNMRSSPVPLPSCGLPAIPGRRPAVAAAAAPPPFAPPTSGALAAAGAPPASALPLLSGVGRRFFALGMPPVGSSSTWKHTVSPIQKEPISVLGRKISRPYLACVSSQLMKPNPEFWLNDMMQPTYTCSPTGPPSAPAQPALPCCCCRCCCCCCCCGCCC